MWLMSGFVVYGTGGIEMDTQDFSGGVDWAQGVAKGGGSVDTGGGEMGHL